MEHAWNEVYMTTPNGDSMLVEIKTPDETRIISVNPKGMIRTQVCEGLGIDKEYLYTITFIGETIEDDVTFEDLGIEENARFTVTLVTTVRKILTFVPINCEGAKLNEGETF